MDERLAAVAATSGVVAGVAVAAEHDDAESSEGDSDSDWIDDDADESESAADETAEDFEADIPEEDVEAPIAGEAESRTPPSLRRPRKKSPNLRQRPKRRK